MTFAQAAAVLRAAEGTGMHAYIVLSLLTEARTPELRHSFVSLLSDDRLPLEEISRLVDHSSTATTEAVHSKQIRPVVQYGAVAMDRIFGALEGA